MYSETWNNAWTVDNAPTLYPSHCAYVYNCGISGAQYYRPFRRKSEHVSHSYMYMTQIVSQFLLTPVITAKMWYIPLGCVKGVTPWTWEELWRKKITRIILFLLERFPTYTEANRTLVVSFMQDEKSVVARVREACVTSNFFPNTFNSFSCGSALRVPGWGDPWHNILCDSQAWVQAWKRLEKKMADLGVAQQVQLPKAPAEKTLLGYGLLASHTSHGRWHDRIEQGIQLFPAVATINGQQDGNSEASRLSWRTNPTTGTQQPHRRRWVDSQLPVL